MPVFRTLYRKLNEKGEWTGTHPFQFQTYNHETLSQHMEAFNREFGRNNPKILCITQGMVRNRQGVMFDLNY